MRDSMNFSSIGENSGLTASFNDTEAHMIQIKQIMDLIFDETSEPSIIGDIDMRATSTSASSTISIEKWQLAFSWVFSFCEGDNESQNCRILYKYTYGRLKLFATNLLYPLFQEALTEATASDFLLRYCTAWKAYQNALANVHSLLNHLNKNFVKTMGLTNTYSAIYDEKACIEECIVDTYCLGLLVWKEKVDACKDTLQDMLYICLKDVRDNNRECMMLLIKQFYNDIQFLDDHLANNFLDYAYETLRRGLILSVFTEFSRNHYENLSQKLVAFENDIHQLMRTILIHLDKEKEIFGNFPADVWESISKEFFEKLVKRRLHLLQAHIPAAVDNKRISSIVCSDLHDLFRLLYPLDECASLFTALREKFLEEIKSHLLVIPLTSSTEVKQQFFDSLDSSYDKIQHFIETNFIDFKEQLQHQLNHAFEAAIGAWKVDKVSSSSSFNSSPDESTSRTRGLVEKKTTLRPHPANLLVLFMHDLLKQGTLTTEICNKLFRAVKFVDYLEEKDLFVRHYIVHFNRRFLLDFPAGEEIEGKLLHLLHGILTSCDLGSRLFRMLKDYRALKELNEKFQKSLLTSSVGTSTMEMDVDSVNNKVKKSKKHTNVSELISLQESYNFKIYLITSCVWSLKNDLNHFIPPQSCSYLLTEFENHYRSCFPHRRIQWMHTFSTITMTYNKDEWTNFQLKLSAASAFLLQYFDELKVNRIHVNILAENLCPKSIETPEEMPCALKYDLSDDDSCSPFLTALNPLVKSRLLLLEDNFVKINPDFNCSDRCVDLRSSHVTSPEQKMRRSEMVTILADRRFFLDCCIMRIMKSLKKVNHEYLINKVQEEAQNRFEPSIRDIKEVIGHLIDRGFLRRSVENMDMYEYAD